MPFEVTAYSTSNYTGSFLPEIIQKHSVVDRMLFLFWGFNAS